ncbi:unnamed protein product [Ixodes hexagonus]
MEKGSLLNPYGKPYAGLDAPEVRVPSTMPAYTQSPEGHKRRCSARTQASLFSDNELDRYATVHGASTLASIRSFADTLRRKTTDLDRYANLSESVTASIPSQQPLLEQPYGTVAFPFRVGDAFDHSNGRPVDQGRLVAPHSLKSEKPFHSEVCMSRHWPTMRSEVTVQSVSAGRMYKTLGTNIMVPKRVPEDEYSKERRVSLPQSGAHVEMTSGKHKESVRPDTGLSANSGVAWSSTGPRSATTPSSLPPRSRRGDAHSPPARMESAVTSHLATPRSSESSESSTSSSTTSETSSTSDDDSDDSKSTALHVSMVSTSTRPSAVQAAADSVHSGVVSTTLSSRPTSLGVAGEGNVRGMASQKSRGSASLTSIHLLSKQRGDTGKAISLRSVLTTASENANRVVAHEPDTLSDGKVSEYLPLASTNTSGMSSTTAQSANAGTPVSTFTGQQNPPSLDERPLLPFQREVAHELSRPKPQPSKGMQPFEAYGGNIGCNTGQEPPKYASLPRGRTSKDPVTVVSSRSTPKFKPASSNIGKRPRRTEGSLLMHLCVAVNVILFSALSGIVFAYFLHFGSKNRKHI